ncbi:MAG: hypothetical protein EXS14_03690 [Planctomycetes bacterium]|nr:hypothetical protein [Planctomycetota bacterium]
MKRRSSSTQIRGERLLSIDELKPMLPGGALRVRGITADAAAVHAGMLYVQTTSDADALQRALQRGAAGIVSEAQPQHGCALPWFRVQDALRVLGHVASRFAAEPSSRLEVSVFAGDAMRRDMRCAAALIHARDDGALVEERIARTPRSLGSAELHQRMAQHAARQGRSVLLECRESDLCCGRLEGVNLAAALVGLGDAPDAADIESALTVMRMLPAEAVAVLEAGHPTTAVLAATTNALVVTWGFAPEADVRATLVRQDRNGVLLHVRTPVGACELELAAMDLASQRAALAALAHAAIMGMAPERAAERLRRRVSSAEALERMPVPLGFDVWTTRARSRDALARALRAMHPFTKGRVLLVPPTGSGSYPQRASMIQETLDAAERGDGVLIALEGNGDADRSSVREWFLGGLTDVA